MMKGERMMVKQIDNSCGHQLKRCKRVRTEKIDSEFILHNARRKLDTNNNYDSTGFDPSLDLFEENYMEESESMDLDMQQDLDTVGTLHQTIQNEPSKDMLLHPDLNRTYLLNDFFYLSRPFPR